jgi:hypothetical protein
MTLTIMREQTTSAAAAGVDFYIILPALEMGGPEPTPDGG